MTAGRFNRTLDRDGGLVAELRVPRQVPDEPACSQARHLVERARFFEEMRRAGYDGQVFLDPQHVKRFPVHRQHGAISLADDKERGRLHHRQDVPREIRTPAPRDDGCYGRRPAGGGHKRGPSSGARAEVPDSRFAPLGVREDPVRGGDKPVREQRNVEA